MLFEESLDAREGRFSNDPGSDPFVDPFANALIVPGPLVEDVTTEEEVSMDEAVE